MVLNQLSLHHAPGPGGTSVHFFPDQSVFRVQFRSFLVIHEKTEKKWNDETTVDCQEWRTHLRPSFDIIWCHSDVVWSFHRHSKRKFGLLFFAIPRQSTRPICLQMTVIFIWWSFHRRPREGSLSPFLVIPRDQTASKWRWFSFQGNSTGDPREGR